VRLLFDANLSPAVAHGLREAGHDSVHVADIELLTASDPVILQAAADQDRVLVTADADFGALLALSSLATPSVVLLRSADHMRPAEQADLLAANLPTVADALDESAIASLSRDRLRIRLLPIADETSGEESGDRREQ
jgi:Uncharacterized protein conserved in bacteria